MIRSGDTGLATVLTSNCSSVTVYTRLWQPLVLPAILGHCPGMRRHSSCRPRSRPSGLGDFLAQITLNRVREDRLALPIPLLRAVRNSTVSRTRVRELDIVAHDQASFLGDGA